MYMWWYVWTLLLITVFDYNVWHNHAGVWSKFRPDFDTGGSQFGRNFDQTSTLGGRSLVEILTKLRPPQCRSLVEVWSQFGRSLVEVWCRSLVGIFFNQIYYVFHWSTEQPSTKLRHWGCRSLVEVWSKFRPNFDPPVSKFGRNLCQASTPQCRMYAHINFKTSIWLTQIVVGNFGYTYASIDLL